MPSKYRHRSTMSWFIWGTACLVLVALLAWQFEWFPRQKTNDIIEKENSIAATSDSMPTPDDREIFQQQPEPGLENKNPFADENDNSTSSSDNPFEDTRLRQAGFADTQKKNSNPFESSRNRNSQLQNSRTNIEQPTKNSPQLLWKGDSESSQTNGNDSNRNSFTDNRSKPKVWEGVSNSHPPREFFQKVDRLRSDGEIFDAHHELSTVYWKHPEWRADIKDRIQKTAKAIYFSRDQHFIDPYVVQYGDNLTKIAARYKLSWQYLATLNDVNPTSIREGNRLKVHNGPFSVMIDLSDFELIVYHHGYFVRKYRIGIGKNNTTPIGKFKVLNKEVNPEYTTQDERSGKNIVIAGGDPSNPLGRRWIDIGDSFGIHGTIDPDSIGRAESKGCIRLRNADVADVFDFLIVGSEVVIRK